MESATNAFDRKDGWGDWMKKIFVLIALVLPAAACATARAHVPPEDRPALVVPPVPPRVIEPLPILEPQAIEAVPDLPAEPASPPRPRPAAPNRPATESKPEVKPDTVPDPAIAPPAPPPVSQLRTPATAEAPEAARQIREVIDRATRLLNSTVRDSLSNDRQANYDAARSWLQQADEALKKNNLELAKSLADRAEQIAKLLSARS